MIFKKRFLLKTFLAMGASHEEALLEINSLVKRKMLNKAFFFYYGGEI
jgi:hypothetical protein